MPLGAADEFRDLVKALHRAGLEVILDVVYNHTAEGGVDGPTFCFRGLANEEYYLLDGRGGYADYSGTGNTLNANAAIVRRLIVDSLRYWVAEMHVDGFRFDLASVLSRDEDGQPLARPADPVGHRDRPGPGRDEADRRGVGRRRAVPGRQRSWATAGWSGTAASATTCARSCKGDPGTRLGRQPAAPRQPGHLRATSRSRGAEDVNFVTCHDGFTLNDLVSLRPQAQRGERRGQPRREQRQPQLELRRRGPDRRSRDRASCAAARSKNLLALDLLAVGVPMLPMGDEVRRTQGGNNNAYCQDNELSWFDWSAVERHAGMLRFTAALIAARRRAQELLDLPIDVTLLELLATARIDWHGVALGPAGSLGRLAQHGAHDLRPIGGAPHHLQRLLGAARLRAPGARARRRRPGGGSSTRPSQSPDDIALRRGGPGRRDGRAIGSGPRSVVVLAARSAVAQEADP